MTETLQALVTGFDVALQPINLLWGFVGVTLGTTMEDYIKAELPKAQMKRVESPATGWQEVLAGRVDYTLSTLIEASGLQQKHPEIQMILTNQARSALPMSSCVVIVAIIVALSRANPSPSAYVFQNCIGGRFSSCGVSARKRARTSSGRRIQNPSVSNVLLNGRSSASYPRF